MALAVYHSFTGKFRLDLPWGQSIPNLTHIQVEKKASELGLTIQYV